MYIEIKNFDTAFEFELCIEDITYYPERPAPACQNRDSPRFSDCGDSEEFEYQAYLKINGKKYVVPRFFWDCEPFRKAIEDEIREKADIVYDEAHDWYDEAHVDYIGGGRL